MSIFSSKEYVADPRWSDDVIAAINAKVEESMSYSPRLGLASSAGQYTEDDRKKMLKVSFSEIVKATSIDTLVCAPPALLEQFCVLAVSNNENVKGILVQFIRVFMMLLGTPETNLYAQNIRFQMEEEFKREMKNGRIKTSPELVQWKKMPC